MPARWRLASDMAASVLATTPSAVVPDGPQATPRLTRKGRRGSAGTATVAVSSPSSCQGLLVDRPEPSRPRLDVELRVEPLGGALAELPPPGLVPRQLGHGGGQRRGIPGRDEHTGVAGHDLRDAADRRRDGGPAVGEA